jgi:hypothetical protein
MDETETGERAKASIIPTMKCMDMKSFFKENPLKHLGD